MKPDRIMKYLCLILLAYGLASCSKMDATYEHFVKDGLVIYTPRIDSLKAFSGKDRILLSGRISSRVDRYVVYWNNGGDSLVKKAPFQNVVNDTLRLMVENLMEKTYFFDVVTYDQYGHASVPSSAKGRVYGPKYQQLLENRSIKEISQHPDTEDATIDWFSARTGELGIELRYMDNSGDSLTVFVADSIQQTTLPAYKHGSSLSYRSMYLPEPTAVDTFFCAYRQVELPD